MSAFNLPIDKLAIDSDEDEYDQELSARSDDPHLLGRRNFKFGKTLGEGSYARVVHAMMKNDDSHQFAIKITERKAANATMEKQILLSLSHPLIITYYLLICLSHFPSFNRFMNCYFFL